ncbi:DUF3788 domain-containing protein [Clostridium intestinale]|uniref:DUF3788 domain-containing protein n=1 Tax=Clostridium intestinale TaxID=36845 RepID=UPI0028E1F429|nr:DUF3788 domain-containing protein [Clostridium intestinale]WRY53707.1 DUF3788 domain-containing protein [Clostridium intestinale]
MLENIPTEEELKHLMGDDIFRNWSLINKFIEKNYEMDILWNKGGKTGVYELKYRKSSKTLCALYPKEQGLCILIIFGKAERDKFENSREEFSEYINKFYDNTKQYHDGKWLYINRVDDEIAKDIEKLLLIKKRPNKKLKSS